MPVVLVVSVVGIWLKKVIRVNYVRKYLLVFLFCINRKKNYLWTTSISLKFYTLTEEF